MKYNLLVLAPVQSLQPARRQSVLAPRPLGKDLSTLHSHHDLERDLMTRGHKMMTERGREQWLRGKGGKQEVGPGAAMQFRAGEKQC